MGFLRQRLITSDGSGSNVEKRRSEPLAWRTTYSFYLHPLDLFHEHIIDIINRLIIEYFIVSYLQKYIMEF